MKPLYVPVHANGKKLNAGKMLENLKKESFEPYLNQRFQLRADPETRIDLKLVLVAPLGSSSSDYAGPSGRREPFRVHFKGPQKPLLPQHMYPIEHAELGVFELFIVPIGPDEDGLLYEAIFN